MGHGTASRRRRRHQLLLHHALGRDLPEHLDRVEPGLELGDLELGVQVCHSDALYINLSAVCLGRDLFSVAIEWHGQLVCLCVLDGIAIKTEKGDKEKDILVPTDIVLLHGTPVPPAERHDGRPAVDLEDLPGKGRHHALEGLVARGKVRVPGAVVFVGGDDGVVSPDPDHGLGRLGWAAIDGKCVRLGVHGPPVGDGRLERGLDLPVLDQVLDQILEGAGSMGLLLCC